MYVAFFSYNTWVISIELCKTLLCCIIGGSYRSWKRRYFVLRKSTLTYYAAEGDKKPKGVIDLTHGRGVRSKEQCRLDEEEWPVAATSNLAFGVAVEYRTLFVYGCVEAAVE